MTKKACASGVLVCTLVLSSGACFSEAFFTSTATGATGPGTSANNHHHHHNGRLIYPYQRCCNYAPKDTMNSFGAGGPGGGASNPGKRRRGRPRKTAATSTSTGQKNKQKTSRGRGRPRRTTTTATAATATTTSVSTSSRRKSNSNNEKKKDDIDPPTKGSTSGGSNPLLDHELLTKEEEQILGGQIRKATDIQATMTLWIEENRDRILQQQEYQRLESISPATDASYGDDFDGGEEDNDIDRTDLLYGSAASQAIERHYVEESQDDIFYPYGSASLRENSDDEDDDDFQGMSIFEARPQQLQPSVPESWMDEILSLREEEEEQQQQQQGNSDDLSQIMTTSSSHMMTILSDDDIRRVLDLPGGRMELRAILLEGALAKERLIRSNVRLVHSIAKKWVGDTPAQHGSNSLVKVYSGSTGTTATSVTGRPTLEEALQEGIMGLSEAAERFDPDRGFRFSTYATMWVTNSVRKCFQFESTSGLRLPIPYYEIKRKYVTRVRYYLNTVGEVPAMDVLADDLGVTVKRLVVALQMTQPMASLDSPIAGSNQGSSGAGKSGNVDSLDDGYTLASMLACDEPQPEDHVERSLLRQCLENAMATELSPNERDVVRLRLGLDDGVPQTVREVAEVFGGRFTQAAIRAMEHRAFNKLRSPFSVHTQQLLAYLDFAGIDGNNQLLR